MSILQYESKFKDFLQLERTVITDTFECYNIYALVESFIGWQPIYLSQFVKRYAI